MRSCHLAGQTGSPMEAQEKYNDYKADAFAFKANQDGRDC